MRVNSVFSHNVNGDESVKSKSIKKQERIQKRKQISETIKRTAPVIMSLAAIPASALVANKVITKKIAKENAQIWSALIAAAGVGAAYVAGDLSDDDKVTITSKVKERMSSLDSQVSQANSKADESIVLSGNILGKKYLKDINGIQLLINSDSLNKNEQKYQRAIEKIETAAPDRLYNAPNIVPITKPNPTLWSVSSEFAPVKEGGLGSVPVEVQNNVTKLGVNIPTFIPMYQQKGQASFRQEGDKYIYSYKGKDFDLKKVASFKIDTFQGKKAKTEKVEFFVSTTQDDFGNEKQLVFVKNDNYFNGTIYQTTEKTEEPEKFAFFSKAVYEFAKAKEDIKSVKDLKIEDYTAFDSIKSPDGLILNDWQASPIAALARYKAPMENAYGQLSDEATKKLSDMTIITIGHNAMYQGSTQNNNDHAQRKEATTNILNTLFDNFAFDIVSHAKTGASETNPEDSGLKNLDNVLILNADSAWENHTNFLNMGVCLSDYFHPVSQNYANEIISDEHPELAWELRWALNQRNNSGSLVGIINGNDFNNLSIEAKQKQITDLTGLSLKTYNKKSDIETIMSTRLDNKIDLYNNYILPLSMKNDLSNHDEAVENVRKVSSRLEFVDKNGLTVLPQLTDDELAETPVISSVGRLVSQKGIGIMSDAIQMLMENWETDFPGKPKPIFYLAGQDGENGAQRKFIEDLKNNKLSQEDSNRVVFAHGFAPMAALTASSDFFLLPSIFEPCGLTQGESFALATPVIGSAVGGIVDTVNRNGKTNGILTNKDVPLSAEGFYNAMKEGLDIFFNDKEQYKKMVQDSLAEDFSWIQPNKEGPVYDYLERIGISRESLPDVNSVITAELARRVKNGESYFDALNAINKQ